MQGYKYYANRVIRIKPLIEIEMDNILTFRPRIKPQLDTLAFLQFGAPEGQWNIGLFKAAADLYRCGLSKDEIRERLEAISGYLDHKDNQTIASAFRAVEKE